MDAYRVSLIDRLFVAEWLVHPVFDDVLRLETEYLAASRRVNKPMLVIAILASLSPPSTELRLQFEKLLKTVNLTAEISTLVIPQHGIMAALVRTATRTSILVTGMRAKTMIASSIDEAVESLAPRMGMPAAELLRRLRVAGVAHKASAPK